MVASTQPLDLLAEHARRLQEAGVGMPAQEEAHERWSGIGFRIGEHRYLSTMDEVREVLDPPTCTRVPGTAMWFLGVANVRGTLVPVIDLHGFMINGRSSQGVHARVLMYNSAGVSVAFRVDDVFGMQRFAPEERATLSLDAGALAPYLTDGFRRRDEEWMVLNLADLVASQAFLEISQ